MAGIADPVIKLFGGSTDAPTPTQVALDPETQQMINTRIDRSIRPASEFAAEINQNVAQNAQSLGQDQQHAQQQDQRAGGQTPYMADALRQVYSAQSGNDIGKLLKSNDYRGRLAKADSMNQMSQMLMAQQRVATQNNQMLVEAYNQQEMARAQFVSQLFQIGGMAMAMGAARNRKANVADQAGPGGFHTPDVGDGYAGNPNVGGYGLGVSDSGAGGYGSFPGAVSPSRYSLGANTGSY